MRQSLHKLADAAGIETRWRDVAGHEKVVSDESLIAVLDKIGLPARSSGQIAESISQLDPSSESDFPPLITATLNEPIEIKKLSGRYKIALESGKYLEGNLSQYENLHPISEFGYHKLYVDDVETTIAVSPEKAFSLEDITSDKKLWGLAVQLYSLGRSGDNGVGDFQALASFVSHAAARGASAVAISPVHALFSNDLKRFGPYAPSSRTAYNIFHIAERTEISNVDELINWPLSNAAKLKALRSRFNEFSAYDELAAFQKAGGIGLERHAIFEALQAHFCQDNATTCDWRHWPPAYQDPESSAVQRFKKDQHREVSFHIYLQYRADEGLRAAHKSARDSGMRIGIIADLAVGTDAGGSHCWSRQKEVLSGLEIGAPPDSINSEGQSWGITAFSPRGLAASGYSAFIEMLRHALRHAGGVRIDHVMGLSRLWLIPHGHKSSEGAYLKLPSKDLIRLIILESQRHRALVLGEDLGTLPEGFQESLSEAGIAGLRVMWFEKNRSHFTPPKLWTKNAVAMTSTHDLPTVAGWWQGKDIEWRNMLRMAGDRIEKRKADRAELWAAFQESGATEDPMPADSDGGAVANAACAHIGRAACKLTLLPIEDAVAAVEQPNFPGTTDEHPNWRRRLPLSADDILSRPDVAARLAALDKARNL